MSGVSGGWPRLLRRQFDFVDRRIALVRLQNLEELIRDVVSTRSYPVEWVIFRITGIDSATEGRPEPIEGATLLPTLVSLIEDLSRTFGPLPFDSSRDVSLDEAARRLGVSSRTIRRWRGRGLPLVRFEGIRGGRVGVRLAQLEWFVAANRPRVERARRRRAVDADEAAAIRDRFERIRPESRSDAAAIGVVAKETRRSPSTVRSLVLQQGRPSSRLRVDRDRVRRIAIRAHDRSIPLEDIAVRLGRSSRSIRRATLEARVDRLFDLPEPKMVPAGVARTDAARVFAAAGLLDDRCRSESRGSLSAWIAAIRTETDVDVERDRQRMAAMHFALWRAHQGLATTGRSARAPTAARLDQIEADLRWWALLRERSVRAGLAGGLRRLEQSLGRVVEDLPSHRLLELLGRLVDTTAAVVDGFDPERRVLDHSFDRVAGLAVSRMMATIDAAPVPGIARARARLDDLAAPDLLGTTPKPVRPLLAVERWWRAVDGVGDGSAGAEICRIRHGLGGQGRPRSWKETAREVGRPSSHLVAEAGRFERSLRRRAILAASDGA